ncbi:MAG: hypothetical protein IIX50_00620, partial [Bacteroidaceae bacterium]|nr:hypothetical protein [Bacteroidaceae bacterium]
MQVSLFNGFADKNPKPITIREVVEIIRADQRLQVLTENHRRYRAQGDTARAEAEKQHMPCYSVAVLFSGGKQQKHIVSYTGMSIVDLDHIPGERMAEVLEKVRSDEHTLLAYTTISGEGVRILFRYKMKTHPNPPCEGGNSGIAEPIPLPYREGWGGSLYKHAFLTGNEYYSNLLNLPYDEKCKNATRISGMAHDSDVYYNPNAVAIIVDMMKKSVGRPKGVKSEKGRVKSCKVGDVERLVQRELERRGVVYAPGTHNKYISDACYMMNRYGVSESDCTAWALDKFADYQAEGNDVASIVRSCYLQTEEHGTARPPKAVSDKQATVAQIEAFLAERVQLRRNVVTGFVEVRETETPSNLPLYGEALQASLPNNSSKQPEGAPHRGGRREGTSVATTRDLSLQRSLAYEYQRAEGVCGSSWRQFTDDDRNSLWRALSKELGVRVVRQDISAVVKSDFSPRYHPFEEYIGSLQPWNGATDHIARLASSVTVKGDQEYFARCFKKWLVAFIAAIFDPEEVNHEILVFIGRQGSYKSTWFHYLLPPELRQYFLPKLMSNSGITKDDLFKIAQSGLVCLEEIDNMKQRDLNQLKALTTM